MNNINKNNLLDIVEKLSVNDNVKVRTENIELGRVEVCQIEKHHDFAHSGKAVCLTKKGEWPNLIIVNDYSSGRAYSYSPVAKNGDNIIFENEGEVKDLEVRERQYSTREYQASNFL